MRTFIAINLPQPIRDQIGEHLDSFRRVARGIGWIPPGNAHITIKFLGDVPQANLEDLSLAVQTAVEGARRFEVKLGGFGAFPNFRKPRVFWIGITEGIDPLQDLAAAIDNELHRRGYEKEKRKFSAHITLGRIRKPGNYQALEQAANQTQYSSGAFPVPSVEIMKSVLTPQGAQYSVFESFALEG